MPPPPPPSKSYLLVLDSDSSDDSEDEYRRLRQEYNDAQRNTSRQLFGAGENGHSHASQKTSEVGSKKLSIEVPKEPVPLVSPPPSPSHEDCDESLSNTDNELSPKKLTKNQKRRRQRKKKKKEAREQANEEIKSKNVSFSNVAIREFPRAFSGEAVPGHGGWPLGMKLDGYEDLDKVPIEEYETAKQYQLHEQWMAILSSAEKKSPPGSPAKCPSSPSKKKKEKEKVVIDEKIIRLMDGNTSSCGKDDSNDTTCKNTIYETRQWDYRSRIRNPLFGVVSEDERHALFLEASGTDVKMAMESPTHNNSRRKRSNSFGNHSHSNGGSSRSRSNSFGSHDLGNSIKGKFNEEYSQAMVHHVRNELEQLRFERNKSGATGCNCRKLVVYLPPKDGSGGKKAQHRRLKPSKVVQELKKRNLYDESVAKMSREQLEKLLHKTVESEPCCRDESCFCFRNGIVCQADACSCWHDSHVHAKHSSGSNGDTLSNDDIRKRCGNPLGTYLVDTEAIDRYRTELIQQAESNESDMFICRPVSAT
mmetsp:Transcript_4075/g.9728  ORF Transcript_4075/g.9728 Transcript_4075/m.9728 type:complete len:534 (+) Transcript_4075:73-1674(+)